jgi:mono/diheme cytochrome c family protein
LALWFLAIGRVESGRDTPKGLPTHMPTARFFASIFAVGAVTLLWLAANSQVSAYQNAAPSPAPVQNTALPLGGAAIFKNYCSSCHGASGSGDGPVAPALKAKVPMLTTLARRNRGKFPSARVRSIIAGDENHAAHGSREMPVWGPLFHQIQNDQDLGYVRLQNVTEYLISIQQK